MRKFIGTVTALAVAVGLTLVPLTPATALSAGVDFSADSMPTWQTNGVVYALGHAHGKVVAGGTFSQIRPPDGASGSARDLNALAIFDADSGNPDSCQLNVSLSGGTPTIRAIASSPDGNSVFVAGNFSNIGGVTVGRLAQIDPVSCTVEAFRPPFISSTVLALAVTHSTIYIGGQFHSVDGAQRDYFAALDSSTGKLLPWVANADQTGRAIAVSPEENKVAIGGDFFNVNGQYSHSIAVVDAVSGNDLQTYPAGFLPNTSVTKAIASDGTNFYVANEGTGGGVFDGSFAVSWDSLDQQWRDTCLGATQAILPYKGTLYEAHHHHDCGLMNEFQDGGRHFFSANSSKDADMLGWFPNANDGIGEGIGPRALTVATGTASGKHYLWSGGEFTRINGVPQQSLTRFGPDDTGAPPAPSPKVTSLSSSSAQIRFRTVTDDDDDTLTYKVYRDGSTTPTWQGTAKSVWWARPQVTVVDDDVKDGSTHTYRVTASDGTNTSPLSAAASVHVGSNASAYAEAVIKDSPSLYWQYDDSDSTWAQDSSGASTEGMNGLYKKGATHGGTGVLGGSDQAAQLDGADDYIWNDQLRPAPKTYSIETWFKTSTTRGGMLVGYGNGRPKTDSGNTVLSNNHDRHLYMDNAGKLLFGVWTGSAQTVQTSGSYNDDNWHHVVATQGPTGMKLYVDGIEAGHNSVTTAQDYYGVWHIGGDNLSGWPNQPSSNFFTGEMDETAIYNSVLSDRSVTNHYELGGGTPIVNTPPSDAYGAAIFNSNPDLFWRLNESAGSKASDSSYYGQHPGTYGNAVQLNQKGFLPNATAIGTTGDSSSLVAESAPSSPSAEFSAELWFKTDSTNGGKLVGFENSPDGLGNKYDKQIYMTDSGQLMFGVYNSGVNYAQSSDSYNDNKWHYLVGTQSSDGMKLYVDGLPVGSNDATTNQDFSGYWRIGGGNIANWPEAPSNSFFTGRLAEVAVYSHALSASTISEHYALGINDTEPPSVPENVSASLNDNSAVITWDQSTDNVKVDSYSIYRGSSKNFVPSKSNLLGTSKTNKFTDQAPLSGTSYYKVVAVDAASNTSDISAPAALTIVDDDPPSVPKSVKAQVSDNSASLSWDASTDNVAVSGYTIYRGQSSDFTAGSSSKIGETSSTSYTDSDLDNGTYYYKISADDVAGNTSNASAAAKAVIQPKTTEVTVNPSADAMVYKAQPNTNYGSNTQLSSRGDASGSPISSYLKFALPDAPAGTVLTKATIRLRTSTDPSAASEDSHTLSLSTGAWSESAITWNNRPTQNGPELGKLTGATTTNTSYTVSLDESILSQLSGTTTTLALTSTGSDNLRLWSTDTTHATYRPELTLTYTQR